MTLVAIVQAVYSFFTLCLSYSPFWESVALSLYWCTFWKCFSQPSAGFFCQTKTRVVFQSCWYTSLCSRFYKDKSIDTVSRTWGGNRKRATICSSFDLRERDSEQLAVGCKKVHVLSKQFLIYVQHQGRAKTSWITFLSLVIQYYFQQIKVPTHYFLNKVFLSLKLQREFGGVFVSLLCFCFFFFYFHLYKKAGSLIQLKWCNWV